ncbi:MAG: pitrilysin family protein [Bacteroidota bacterium]|nr:pitrilysin family protein [Bacteroidota bacterium]MDP4232724.1 pitrilysin family protein [Bacteroidota bacterium]MDP4243143.1 pitrilysin family protein [Bacteroidota bacterium]MDP4287600.1 pitrilysin family protein [Bacteroidota bacterium]
MNPGRIDFEEYRLPNGLRVILHEDHKVPVVCVNIAYHAGSKNEDVKRRGFAHLFEHLLFEGSRHVPRGAFDQHIVHAGGHDNAYTTEDITNYYEVLPSHQLELALWLESDRLLEFAIANESLETQKSVVKEEKRERYDNTPYGSVSIRMNRMAYTNFPYWWAVIGDMETIEAATLADVREFYETFYIPSNAVLVLAGDFERNRAMALIDRYFANIPNGRTTIERPIFNDPPLTAERREIIREEPVPLPAVFYAYRVPPEGTDEHFALDLLSDILSSGESARLHRKLVYDLQIASETAAYVDSRECPGLFYSYAVASEVDCESAALEAAFEQVLNEVAANGVTEIELEKAKNKMEARTVATRVTLQGKADQLAHSALIFGDPGVVNESLGRYQKVTLDDIQHVALRYLTPKNRCTLVYEPNH